MTGLKIAQANRNGAGRAKAATAVKTLGHRAPSQIKVPLETKPKALKPRLHLVPLIPPNSLSRITNEFSGVDRFVANVRCNDLLGDMMLSPIQMTFNDFTGLFLLIRRNHDAHGESAQIERVK
jgi:hypothetical protein